MPKSFKQLTSKWSGHKISVGWIEPYDPANDGPEVFVIRHLTQRAQPWYDLQIAIAKHQRWILSLEY